MPQLGLVALLLAELLYLTVRFDSQALDQAASPWLRILSWSPQYLRLGVTIVVVALALARWRRPSAAPAVDRPAASTSSRVTWLALHVLVLFAFVRVSSIVFDPVAAAGRPATWVMLWFVLGGLTLAAWALAFRSRRPELPGARAQALAGLAALVGAAAWFTGDLTESLWTPLARYTFSVASGILAAIYPHVVSDPGKLRLGTPAFQVLIAPACSGYEGIGLLLAFLSAYLWIYRHELRFPAALWLLPIGAVTVWFVNALRIVALIVIGTSGWPAIAKGGFHSQAGWLAFNGVALGFVAVLNEGRFFRADVSPSSVQRTDSTTAYLAPFLVVMATAMITGALSAGIDWLYPLRVVAALCVLWVFRRSYVDLGWSPSWRAIAIGCVTFAIWIAMVPAGPAGGDRLPAALESVPVYWALAWLIVRIVGYTITVPLVEELAFRGYLMRRLMQADFDRLPVGLFSWWSFVVSSLLFGALHGGFWLAGTLAGMTFALALYQRRALGDAVLAHATTNGLIAVYVLATGRWSVWS